MKFCPTICCLLCKDHLNFFKNAFLYNFCNCVLSRDIQLYSRYANYTTYEMTDNNFSKIIFSVTNKHDRDQAINIESLLDL